MTEALPPLRPGDTVAILGGGQLGRMLAMGAARLGLRTIVLDPDPHAPAAQVANAHRAAPFDDVDALDDLSARAARITLEFENVPFAALERLEALAEGGGAPLLPGSRSLRIAADRIEEKRTIGALGLAVAPHRAVDGADDLRAARQWGDLILKTRRLGYDGKGQRPIPAAIGDREADEARLALGGTDLIAEQRLPLDAELSVIAVRGTDGRTIAFDPARNVHENGILRRSTVPADLGALEREAHEAALRIANALGHVGALGVEFFVSDGALVVNEIAPRVHNSGHWTEAVCSIDQFEAHMRAVAGLPLGEGARHADARMENLLGHEADDLVALAADPDVRLHLYGKREAREGRKMGHVTRILR